MVVYGSWSGETVLQTTYKRHGKSRERGIIPRNGNTGEADIGLFYTPSLLRLHFLLTEQLVNVVMVTLYYLKKLLQMSVLYSFNSY